MRGVCGVEAGSSVAGVAVSAKFREYVIDLFAALGEVKVKLMFGGAGVYYRDQMFALLVDEPAQVFAALKRLGVPIWRWDSQALSGCATALRYRLGLLHLPCHQSLTPQALDWIIATLGEVLSRRAASPPSRHTAIACHEP